MTNQLSEYLERNYLFDGDQHRFKLGKSTVSASMEFIESFDKKRKVFGVFMDQSKAFDSVCHNKLLNTLPDLGVKNTALRQCRTHSGALQFKSFFISVVIEDLNKICDPVNIDLKDKNWPMCGDCNLFSVTEVDSGEEKYEKASPPHGDKLFHNFVSRIQKNPGQILRYIREGGSPLFLYLEKDIPQSCQYCGGTLVYELQLLPTVISRLELGESGTGHIEFGTVIVLTCQQSCWVTGETLRSEYVIVQKEL